LLERRNAENTMSERDGRAARRRESFSGPLRFATRTWQRNRRSAGIASVTGLAAGGEGKSQAELPITDLKRFA
jgi:hypothetical protein